MNSRIVEYFPIVFAKFEHQFEFSIKKFMIFFRLEMLKEKSELCDSFFSALIYQFHNVTNGATLNDSLQIFIGSFID